MFYLLRHLLSAASRESFFEICSSAYKFGLAVVVLLIAQSCAPADSPQSVNVSLPILLPQTINIASDGTSLHFNLLVDGQQYAPDTQTGDNAFQISLQLEAEKFHTFSFEVSAENSRYKNPVIVAKTLQETHFISLDDSASQNIQLKAFHYDEFNDDLDLLNNWEEVKRGYDPTRKETKLDHVVVINDAAGGNDYDVADDIAILPNGDWVVSGYSSSLTNQIDMAVWKFHADGQLDTTFHTNGVFTHDNAAGGNSYDRANAIAVLPDGGWVIAGSSFNAAGNSDMALWKFNANGQLDTSFDSDGVFTHGNAAGGNYNDIAFDVATLPDGGWICAGFSAASIGTSMTLWKFTASGQLDTTFDGDGIYTQITSILNPLSTFAYALAVFPDGGWLVAGSASNSNGDDDMAIWKFLPNGQLDSSFGNAGIFTHSNAAGGNGSDVAQSIALLEDGGWVVAGNSTSPSKYYDMAVWKFAADGKLDSSFANAGVFTNNNAAGGNSLDVANSVASIPGGGWIVAGYSVNAAGNNDMTLWKFNSNGELDPTFGFNGIYTHDNAAGGTSHDEAFGITVLSADQWVVVGDSKNSANYDAAIW